MKTIHQKTWSIILLILWMTVIFYFSSRPGFSTGLNQDRLIRKMAHVAEFAVLTLIAFRTAVLFTQTKLRKNKKRAILIATFLFALVYALSDELHQRFVPHREGKLMDVAIDAIGILGALFIIHLAPKIKNYFSSLSSAKGKK